MATFQEPDDVDFVVEGGETDPEALRETAGFIKAYKQRPEYAEESRRAEEVLSRLGIRAEEYGIDDPGGQLEHWRRCAEDLTGHRPGESNGKPGNDGGSDSR